MSIHGRYGNRKRIAMCAMLAILAIALMAGWAPALAASGGEEGGHEAEAIHGDNGHGEAMGHEGEGHGAVHSPPWKITDSAKVLNFSILAIGLFLLLRKPVSQALNARIKGIQDELEDLESRKAEVEKQLADYNTKLATLDKEAEQVIAEYVRQGEEAKVRILKEAEASAEKLKEQAQKNIEHEFQQAKKTLQVEIVEKALAKAEQIIKGKVTEDDQNRLVDEYLEKVVA